MWRAGESERVQKLLRAQLMIPYAIGGPDPKTGEWIVRGKPLPAELEPKEFDCSGLSRWTLAQGQKTDGGIVLVPHGTKDQIKFCRPLGAEPLKLFDLGFADLQGRDGAPYHVVIRAGKNSAGQDIVIEARGKQGDKYGYVIEKLASVWEVQKGFLGWWRAPGIHD